MIHNNFDRLPFISESIINGMFFNTALYNFTWYGYLLTSLTNWRGIIRRPLIFLHIMLFVQLGIYVLTYVITPHDLQWHISTSLDRLLLHLIPLAILITAINVGQKVRPERH